MGMGYLTFWRAIGIDASFCFSFDSIAGIELCWYWVVMHEDGVEIRWVNFGCEWNRIIRNSISLLDYQVSLRHIH